MSATQEGSGSPVWLVTGCSTGIGRAVARAALEAGARVALSARDPASLEALVAEFSERAIGLRLDVTEADQIEAAVAQTQSAFGQLDVLVNNAGYGYVGAVEEGVDEDVRKMFDTNFFGAVALIKAVLPGMRARRSGLIVNMSSTTGFVPMPGNIYYSTSKFALESLTEGLAKELAPLGIRVCAVEPGFFRSDWASRSMQESPRRIDDYEDTVGQRRELIRTAGGLVGEDPRRVGDAIVWLSRLAEPPVHLLLGRDVFEAVRAQLDGLQQSIERWRDVSLGGELPGE